MNKLGLHANVWVAGWSEDEAALAIAKTAETGFDLIEIPALDAGGCAPPRPASGWMPRASAVPCRWGWTPAPISRRAIRP